MKERLAKCIRQISKQGLDALLISQAVNITYLTGFRPAEGYLLLTAEGGLFYFTSFLYKSEAVMAGLWKTVENRGSIFNDIRVKVKSLKLKKIGFEAGNMSFLEYKKIKGRFSRDPVDFIETKDLIEDLRAIKTSHEISLIKKSVGISQEAFEFVKEIYDETMTEKTLSIEIEKFLRLKGDNTVAFPPIVAAGQNSAIPHYLSGESVLGRKYFLIDLGSKYCGYCADLTRVFFWGKMPPFFIKIHDIIRKARDYSIKKIKPGVKIKEIDTAARNFIAKKGYDKYFGHGVGHGIGLSVHELPSINAHNENILKEGMVFTIEPAVYIEGRFGIRIEDMVLVKMTGAEVLSGNTNW